MIFNLYYNIQYIVVSGAGRVTEVQVDSGKSRAFSGKSRAFGQIMQPSVRKPRLLRVFLRHKNDLYCG